MTTAADEQPAAGAEQQDRARAASPVVGIGASAGGIEALQRFFRAVPPDSGTAFVVVQHLAPDHPSTLAALLSRTTRLPVIQVDQDVAVAPDAVYVIRPNATLTLAKRRLHVGVPDEPRGQRNPIDDFLLSLARDQGENAACVILSGTGSDGTVGLRAIKEHGGLTLAQADAEYDGMMRSAVATGLVDFILPVEAIAAKLTDYFRHLGAIGEKKGPDGVRRETTDHLAKIAELIRARTGHDFKDYKDKTIARRVERRMQILQIDDIAEFVELLKSKPQRIDLLFQDLLIGVTNFFRDPKAFEALERLVVPRLFEGKGADDSIRVWVPGCSTGEEAYSIAILLGSTSRKTQNRPKLQIFASDIDEQALEIARIGRYPELIVKDVRPERLAQYFLREDGTYCVIGEIREICLFCQHNLLRDPPFSKLDLISCRNLLIYLNTDVQDRVFPLLHYALRDDGYLFLGSSESVTRYSRLFATADKTYRVFRRRPQAERTVPAFPLFAPDVLRRRAAVAAHPGTAGATSLPAVAEQEVLERFAPAYVVVNSEGDILHSSSRTGKYLELPPGAPNANVLEMARPALRLDLRAALHKAQGGQPVARKNLAVQANGGWQALDVVVQPFRHPGSEEFVYLVVFQDIGGATVEAEPIVLDHADDVHFANVKQLETELQLTRERLQTSTEELESANEELKSSNEELSSMNEELQSTNEELETSREELQSINEELQTVNGELQARVEELSRSTSDMANLLASTQIATVFVDRDLRIKSFTPSAKDVFRLVDSDIGRSITHVRSRFSMDTVREDAERVLRTLTPIEREVEATDSDARYVMRILPYRTLDNVIDGVVFTFMDISRISAAEARISELTRDLRNRVESLETVLDLVPVGIFLLHNSDPGSILVNRWGATLLGEDADFRGLKSISSMYRLLQGDVEVPVTERPLQTAARTAKPVSSIECRLLRPDGRVVDVIESATPLFDEHGNPRGAIAAVVDISERKRAEQHQQVLLHELQHRVKNILATISSLAARMLRNTSSLQEFSAAFQERLRAMGRMHDILSQRSWIGADLSRLIDAAVSPYATAKGSNIELSGPDVLLKPDVASALGMVLHELATNAAKYGALGNPDGRLQISWGVEGSGQGEKLSFSWLERSASPITPPDHEGFGSTFIRRSVEYELEGTVELAFEPPGLRCAISFPLLRNTAGLPPLSRPGDASWPTNGP